MPQEKKNKVIPGRVINTPQKPQEALIPTKESEEKKEVFHHGIQVPKGHMLVMDENGEQTLMSNEDIIEEGYQDNFALISDAFDSENVINIELPKMLFKNHVNANQSYREKSSVLITLRNDIEAIKSGVFKKAYKAAQKERIKLELHWLDEENQVISKWIFNEAYVSGLDFNVASRMEREEMNSFMLEVEYAALSVDNVSF